MESGAQGPRTLWPIAVRADGRRRAEARALDEAGPLPGAPEDPVLLDHAGPRAALWSPERSLGATEVPEVESGRRPRPLDEEGWRALVSAYASAAERVRAQGREPVLGVDDDGLLQGALSPRTGYGGDEERRARVLALHRACGPVDVALCVEELAPGGLDATDGIEAARALVGQGARTVYASAGSRAFPPLLTRAKGASVGDLALGLRSAAWLVGRVPVRVVALCPRTDERLRERARALGLDDVAARGAP